MDSQLAASLWQQMQQGLRGCDAVWPLPAFIDRATFSSAFAVSELAATSIGLATQVAAALIAASRTAYLFPPVAVAARYDYRWRAPRGCCSSIPPVSGQAPALCRRLKITCPVMN